MEIFEVKEVAEGTINTSAAKYDYRYSDAPLFASAFKYSHELGRQSLALAIASKNIKEREDFFEGSKNLEEFFSNCGYKDFCPNEDYKIMPRANSFGVGIARKEVMIGSSKYTILAIGLRGGNYYAEWVGNFNVGTTGDHNGFEIATNKAFDHLKKYICDFEIKGDVILWVSGFSRAGAVTNLLGARIDKILACGEQPFEGVTLSARRAFFYTFEAPRGAMTNNVEIMGFKNIFNIVNQNDIIIYTAPKAMGFARYGTDIYLPVKDNTEKDEYNKIRDDINKIFDNTSKEEIKRLNPRFMFDSLMMPSVKKMFDKGAVADFIGDFFDKFSAKLGNREDAQDIFIAIQRVLELLVFPESGASIPLGKLLRGKEVFYKALEESGIDEKTIDEAKKYIAEIGTFFADFSKDYQDEFDILMLNLFSMISTHDSALEFAYMMALSEEYFRV